MRRARSHWAATLVRGSLHRPPPPYFSSRGVRRCLPVATRSLYNSRDMENHRLTISILSTAALPPVDFWSCVPAISLNWVTSTTCGARDRCGRSNGARAPLTTRAALTGRSRHRDRGDPRAARRSGWFVTVSSRKMARIYFRRRSELSAFSWQRRSSGRRNQPESLPPPVLLRGLITHAAAE